MIFYKESVRLQTQTNTQTNVCVCVSNCPTLILPLIYLFLILSILITSSQILPPPSPLLVFLWVSLPLNLLYSWSSSFSSVLVDFRLSQRSPVIHLLAWTPFFISLPGFPLLWTMDLKYLCIPLHHNCSLQPHFPASLPLIHAHILCPVPTIFHSLSLQPRPLPLQALLNLLSTLSTNHSIISTNILVHGESPLI